ncbi:RICIN domain-containing protein [Streptomyces ficellus]|uniref:Hydrolase n=1 Tax=Streptomyces ficellus TaxID=1977088 RepID=A0A6I6FT28_9ACTN|nr:RICIN domain-containing protein [Streptomyces ficellus]QGV80166.1 hydrolase [Streptomyces ficellus]
MLPPRPEHSAPPPPPYAPTSGGADAALAGLLGAAAGGGGPVDAYPATALMARHWGAAGDYAALLTGSPAHASMAVSAAFTRVLEELRYGGGGGAAGALRPRLLVAVRHTVREWTDDPRVAGLLAGLRAPAGPGPDRQLVARAFAALPGPAQVLLWHREVEAEGISIPAALLAVDPRVASAQLEDARELFRAGCLRAHSELAADPECRHYNRLLDISLRRGGALIPDIQRHLSKCRHCRYGADQLRHSDGRLPLLLAEGVLGEGARGYVDSRPGRSRTRSRDGAPGAARGSEARGPMARGFGVRAAGGGGAQTRPAEGRRAGRHSRVVPAGAAARRLAEAVPRGGALRVGLGIAVAGVLVVVALSSLWPDGDEGGQRAGAGTPSGAVSPGDPVTPQGGAVGGPAPGQGSPPAGAAPRPPESAGHADGDGAGALRTRLRNAGAGECLDVRDGLPRVGAELVLAPCSGSGSQVWRYERDGLLRSAAAPTLCPHSQESSGAAVLRLCEAQAAVTVRYDLSVQGHVVPRWHAGLGLVPATALPGAGVVVKMRDGTEFQRWLTDNAVAPATPAPRRASGTAGDAGGEGRGGGARDGAGPSPGRPSGPSVPGQSVPGQSVPGPSEPRPSVPGPGSPPGERYAVRGVTDPAPAPEREPAREARAALSPVIGSPVAVPPVTVPGLVVGVR